MQRFRTRSRLKSETFAIQSLFAAGEKGVWYDPSDLSTLFADSDGTIPATVNGTVGKMLDKSGNGYHMVQTDSTKRPTLKYADGSYYLLPDGSNDFMSCASVNLSGTNKVTVVAGLKKLSDASIQLPIEFSANSGTNNGAWGIAAPLNAGFTRYVALYKGSGTVQSATATAFPAPTNNVLSIQANINTPIINLRVNQISIASTVASTGAGNFGNYTLYLFMRGGTLYPYSGHFYGLIARGAESTGDEINECEEYISRRSLAYTPALTPKAFVFGDSTIAQYLTYNSVPSYINSIFTINNLADPGDGIDTQLAVLRAYSYTGKFSWVIVQIGLNDMNPAETATACIARLQNLINEINRTTLGKASLLISQINPCKAHLITTYGAIDGETAYQKWLDYNDAIAGNGATPITGVTGRITSHVAILNDGNGNLAAEYNVGDDLHENNAGRQVIANAWVAALEANNITV